MTAPGAEAEGCILALNAGSSSLKFALHRASPPHTRELSGRVERIGSTGAVLTVRDIVRTVEAPDHRAAAEPVFRLLAKQAGLETVQAVGHRVVHGGPRHLAPEPVTPELLQDLREMSPFDPEHLLPEIDLIEHVGDRLGDRPQVACFDTAFHADLPRVARLLPLPRRYEEQGVRRYGFHGLSYAYLMEELETEAGRDAAHGRVVLAHLGHGASLAAVRDGRSVDTTMAFTPASGIPMGTRSGDLDPGLVWYLARTESMTPREFQDLVHHRSGLLGLSGTTSDMRELLAAESRDPRAAEAVEVFCYEVRKRIGAFAAALGGLDTLVLSGGIGERAPAVRARCCRDLDFLGLRLDEAANARNERLISTPDSRVAVRVILTDEELMIARDVHRTLQEARMS